MDHLVITHVIAKDDKHPSIVGKQAAQTRQDRKKGHWYADAESRGNR